MVNMCVRLIERVLALVLALGLLSAALPAQDDAALRGLRGEWTRRQQERLADSLTALAIKESRSPSDSTQAHLAALELLIAAMRTEGFGVPFERGSYWLKQIAEGAQGEIVERAVTAIATLRSDSALAFPFLYDLARHPGPAAEYAVQHLASGGFFGERGRAEIRELYREGSAGTPRARRMIHYDLRLGESWLGEDTVALAVLRGFGGKWTREQKDALADSLAEFVINRSEADSFESIRSAILTLNLASRAEGGGRPYRGAGERLRRIAETDHSFIFVLFAIAHLPDCAEALRIIDSLARSPVAAVLHAVHWLELRLGQPGLDALRRIYEEGSAGTPRARQQVETIAYLKGWVELEDLVPP